ncbi:hypothetical protein HPG69_011747, partial [Diceros bicornis minor]
NCFTVFYVHKFRAKLGKNQLIFLSEQVLLAWSGGPLSGSGFCQVLEGLSGDSAKRLAQLGTHSCLDEGSVQTVQLSEDSDSQGGESADPMDTLVPAHGSDLRLLQEADVDSCTCLAIKLMTSLVLDEGPCLPRTGFLESSPSITACLLPPPSSCQPSTPRPQKGQCLQPDGGLHAQAADLVPPHSQPGVQDE